MSCVVCDGYFFSLLLCFIQRYDKLLEKCLLCHQQLHIHAQRKKTVIGRDKNPHHPISTKAYDVTSKLGDQQKGPFAAEDVFFRNNSCTSKFAWLSNITRDICHKTSIPPRDLIVYASWAARETMAMQIHCAILYCAEH